MQALSRRLAHQSFNQSPAISSLKSIYPLSDHYYGADHPRLGSTLAPKGVGHLVRKGTGGRSSVSGIVAVVFGATGFLGRYVVQQLAKMGSQVLVPFRGSEDSHRHLKLMGDLGQIVPMKYNPRDENSIKAVMAKANVVLNLIGREYETRNYSFEEVNHHMAEQLAMISKEHGGIMRFIQVSCLGASPSSPSRMLMAKAAAEEAVLRELPEEKGSPEVYDGRIIAEPNDCISSQLSHPQLDNADNPEWGPLKAEAPPRELVFQPWWVTFTHDSEKDPVPLDLCRSCPSISVT
ncbi:NADH dehydrogenase [ubiquinone] 1 alpha subcomplex subunit 9, mitochondrial [Vitis vinifera]|uniref:NADH dehydrogenase [ubiquinone] 1 alpha subcomplex subunit 9, mitochondrial n=1 Tax=Vitis vinifera TaxID=29760 RepID=A0A438KD18_VITVI|nr:NADH dehydrogenase [ubiquinone] 1 alpha subcomplex subunit 9, mitochondrial [Vitis vinifera]